MRNEPLLLEMRGVTKRFFGVPANDDITLALRRGEILALLGENGAGKSTLMKILYGLYAPDAGCILRGGREVRIASPADAIRHRIGMVHQHFTLVADLTVAENVILGLREGRGITLDLGAAAERIHSFSERYGLTVDPSGRIWQLSVGERQRVEILKALYRDAEILILDEPTAVLTPPEARELFASLGALRRQEKGVIFISHKLEEVMEIADRVVVLREGRVVLERETARTEMRELARAMVGGELPDRGKVRGGAFGPPVLEVRGLRAMSDLGVEALGGVSFSVREGEVFAIAGIAGNGQRELAEVLAAVRPATGGEFRFRGERMNGKTPRELFERGIGRIPEDRMESGAILDFPLRDDLALDCYYRPPLARRGLLIRSEVDRRARRLVKEYSIRAHSIDVETGTLSGGNLQKTILARALDRRPGLIIASLPTRGLDIGAADFIHAQLREARDAGAGVLLISEDLDEIFALADTIGVICRGELLRILRVRDADATSLGLLMCGVNGTTAQS